MEKIKANYSAVTENCTVEEAKELNKELFTALANQKTAPALAANQIGINKRLIVINAREPIYLVNPKILETSSSIPYIEAHSSFPNKLFNILRFSTVLVQADNLKKPIKFGTNKVYKENILDLVAIQSPLIMEAVYIQQCIDTLNGKHPSEREPKTPEPRKSEKIRRNNIVTIISDSGETKNLKYKLAEKYINLGWAIKKD